MTHPSHEAAKTPDGTDDQKVVVQISKDMIAEIEAGRRKVKVIHGWDGDGGKYYLFHATHT